MPRQLTALHNQYKAIYTDTKPAGVYADFERGVRDLMNSGADPTGIMAVSRQDPEVLAYIGKTRGVLTYQSGKSGASRFRGTGVIIAGDQRGIAAYDYQAGDGDPVAEKYGMNANGEPTPYQWVALLKVGRAALLHAGRRVEHDFVGSYRWLDEQLVEQGLEAADAPPHHLGYSWRKRDGLRIAVGASGLLVAETIAQARDQNQTAIISTDEAAGWVEWPLDRFAGYDDMYGARSVAQQMVGGGAHPSVDALGVLWKEEVNLH
ncbi:MAG TPA: hypothetical protein VLI54_01505 [Bacillota bacterium]|nr:hypothetical protein [Bacillota bacterium]